MTFFISTFALGANLNAAVIATSPDGFVSFRVDVLSLLAYLLIAGFALFSLLQSASIAKRLRPSSRRKYWKKRLVKEGALVALLIAAVVAFDLRRPSTSTEYSITIARFHSDWVVANSKKTPRSVGDDVARNAVVRKESETNRNETNRAEVRDVSNADEVVWKDAVSTGAPNVADVSNRRVRSNNSNVSNNSTGGLNDPKTSSYSSDGIGGVSSSIGTVENQRVDEPSLDDYPTNEPIFIPLMNESAETTNELPASAKKVATGIAPPVRAERLPQSVDASGNGSLLANFAPSTPIVPYPQSEPRARLIGESRAATRGNAVVEQATYVERPRQIGAEETSLLVQLDDEFNRVSARVKRSVLPIETRKLSKNATKKVEEETGCGFLFQYENRIFLATNRHVVADAVSLESVKIFLPNKTSISPVKLMPCVDFDLAVLELNRADLPTDGSVALCYFGDSDELKVANFVGTVGNPFGLRDTVTYGHVSSLRRRNLSLNQSSKNSLQEYIQIDASINPGNSGGPLYNARGEVVGVVTAIATTSGKNEGVAFAIPINLALAVLKSTIDAGGWRRSHLGVELASATRAELAAANDLSIVSGSKIVRVQSGSPAEKAGLRQDDVVLEFNGESVEDDVHLARLIATCPAVETPTVRVLRGGRVFETKTGLVGGKISE